MTCLFSSSSTYSLDDAACDTVGDCFSPAVVTDLALAAWSGWGLDVYLKYPFLAVGVTTDFSVNDIFLLSPPVHSPRVLLSANGASKPNPNANPDPIHNSNPKLGNT